MKRTFAILSLFFAAICFADTPTISQTTASMQKIAGYFPLYWDAKQGKIWLEIDQWQNEFLYTHFLQEGLGQNDIGLDRGQPGGTHVVKFYRSGSRVLLIESNYGFRALNGDAAQKRSTQESFGQSALWGFTVAAEEGDHVLVDATDFYLQDQHHIPNTLKQTGQGSYRIESSRCAIYLPAVKNFPQNTEVESILTFVAQDNAGNAVQEVVPSGDAITIREHHSFVHLPDAGYKPREFDPRSGASPLSFYDYSSPVGESVVKRWTPRFRLQKKDPSAAVSEAVKPIIYYVDRGAPEPIRSALMEGASWWNQAFEAAGYKNAFRVELLPEDADPLDLRYNVIQWVNRTTRGWSYGNSIVDPRTGEILKGHVTLDSERIRHDYQMAVSLLSPYQEGKPIPPDMLNAGLGRIRQLAAHEVGHTLGFSHNYISSTAGRASVMDYPHPLVKIRDDGSLDLSEAYAKGIGEWDKVSIAYSYQEFQPGADEHAELNAILKNAMARGLIFISDQDARPPGSSHPQAHLWDNGTNAVDELQHVLKVRSIALQHFSPDAIRVGEPLATLEEALVPVYLYHRFQTEAAAKEIGGMYYTYALRGDGQTPTQIVDAAEQRRALNAVLQTLLPETLMLPEKLLRLIPPHPTGFPRTAQVFSSRTGITFDPIAAAESGASIAVSLILNPDRAARLIEFHARDAVYPGFDEITGKLVSATWKSPHNTGYAAEIQRVVDSVVLNQLMALASNQTAETQARAIANLQLESLRAWLVKRSAVETDAAQKAHELFAVQQITQFQLDPKKPVITNTVVLPMGAPIGSED